MNEIYGSESFKKRNPHLYPVSVERSGDATNDEAELHADILTYCKARGWIALHGSMAHRTFRTAGEWDVTCIASEGRVFFIEVKSAKGKLSPEQDGLIQWAHRLGHVVHVVRSYQQFLEIVEAQP